MQQKYLLQMGSCIFVFFLKNLNQEPDSKF